MQVKCFVLKYILINTSLSLLHLSFANFKGYTFSEDNCNGFRQILKQSNEITVFTDYQRPERK